MKRRRKTAFILFATVALLATVSLAVPPIYCKLLCGAARILSRPVDVVLEVDGRPMEGVRCFRESTRFDGTPSNRLVLHIKDPNAILGREILIVAPTDGMVLLPNASFADYRLILNKWLIQSDSGACGVAFGDSKLDARDPDFQQSGNMISFTIPPVLDLPSGRWNLRIGG